MKVYKFVVKNSTTIINLHQVCSCEFFENKVVFTFSNENTETIYFSDKDISEKLCEHLFQYWKEQ